MLLGKRPRPPMKRTTSLSDITADPSVHIPGGPDQRAVHVAAQPPLIYRRHSADLTAEFLRSCSLCKRPLIPSRDIYMYKGDSAFCSVECREQAMKRDERKEKCSLASSKKIANHRHHAAPSSNAETVGAAV